MVKAIGTARIRHAQTGEVYEISADMISFDASEPYEREMGPEVEHFATLHHPALGDLVWSVWEYPIGAESIRQTDVGSHKVLRDFDFRIEFEPPDDDEDNRDADDGDEEDDRQDRINALVEWFHAHYEDPAIRLPYDSREGGYQWIYGGPHDARDELSDNYPNEPEDIIEAAVAEIEADGLTEWAPISSPDDYGEDAAASSDDYEVTNIVSELDALLADLPDPQVYPTFRFGEDNLLRIAQAPDLQDTSSSDALIEELRDLASDLRQSLLGTNAHAVLSRVAHQYEMALSEDLTSISRLYARGVRLANAAHTTQRRIEAEELPHLPSDAEQHLSSVLELHSAYIMSREDGRDLAEGAEAYRRSNYATARMKEAGVQIAAAVDRAPDLFSEEVRETISAVAQDIGEGRQPHRSNQVAAITFANMIQSIAKVMAGSAALIAGQSLLASSPGVEAVNGGSILISAVWDFFMSNAPVLTKLAGVIGADLSWLPPFSNLLDRLRRRVGK